MTLHSSNPWILRRTYNDTEKGEWSIEEVLLVKDLSRMVISLYFQNGPMFGRKWLVLLLGE